MKQQAPSDMTARSWLQLLAWSSVIAVLWCVLLPWLGSQPNIAEHIRNMQRNDINVGAMYYSELNWQPPDGAAFR